MADPKKHFYLKLNPNRASFMADMDPGEREIMTRHVAYWAPLVEDGTVLVLGPVMAPQGGFGMAVVAVDDESHLDRLIAADPALAIGTYETYPMRAVTKKPVS